MEPGNNERIILGKKKGKQRSRRRGRWSVNRKP
jgi:hypothetical protein